MEVIQYKPKLNKESIFFPEQKEVVLMPVGDIQYGPHSDNDRLARHVEWGVKKGAYFIGMGDMVDPMSPSERRLWKSMMENLHDSTTIALMEMLEKKEKELEEILAPTRGRWVGLLRGHHYMPYEDGTTSDSRLAKFLGCPELGHQALVTLDLGKGARCIISAHHGAGSSGLAGGPLSRIQKQTMGIYADIYLVGHTHTKSAAPVPFMRYEVDDVGIQDFSVNRYLVSTGSFLKGFIPGSRDLGGHPCGTYVEKGMMNPVTLGAPVIYIRPRMRNGRSAPDINVSV
jgi:hypothetical protein